MYANKFCDAGQVPIFRNFEAWVGERIAETIPISLFEIAALVILNATICSSSNSLDGD